MLLRVELLSPFDTVQRRLPINFYCLAAEGKPRVRNHQTIVNDVVKAVILPLALVYVLIGNI